MSIDLSLLLSVISIFIALLAMLSSFLYLRETVFYNRESTRAQITLFPRYAIEIESWELVLKNFGNSSGTLLDIKCDPPISYQNLLTPSNIDLYAKAAPITEITNCFLAPGQSFYCDFPFDDYPDTKFAITLRYKTLNRVYTDSYTIDLAFHMKLVVSDSYYSGSHNLEDTINQLTRSIQLLSRKF